jgi:hypothetical protein
MARRAMAFMVMRLEKKLLGVKSGSALVEICIEKERWYLYLEIRILFYWGFCCWWKHLIPAIYLSFANLDFTSVQPLYSTSLISSFIWRPRPRLADG